MTAQHANTIDRRLDEFLSHPTKRVLLLKGKWGVGKTYYWAKTYLPPRLRKEGSIKERLYAYVSLFGVETAHDIEQLILASSVKSGDANAMEFIETGIRKVVSMAELLPVLKDYQGLVRRVGHMAIRSTLICIDEIERKAAGLTLASVMGLVSVLREHNGCRIILIMNDEQITGDDLESFNIYREKVIDETVTYDPVIADNVRLIISDNEYALHFADVFHRIGVSNIRVMQQTAWAVEYFAPYAKSLEPSVERQFREQILLLTAFFHTPSLGINTNNLPRQSLMEYLFDQEVSNDPDRKREMEVARRYGYDIQEYDHLIVDYLKHGHCDRARLESLLDEANEREKQGQFHTKYRDMFTLYKRSFKAGISEVRSRFRSFLDEHAAHIDLSQLRDVLRMTDSIGLKSRRKEWLDDWIAPRIPTSNLSELCEYEKFCTSRTLKAEIKQRKTALRRKVPIAKLIAAVVDDKGWNPDIVGQLGSCDVADFRKEFLAHDENDFLAAIHAFCESWKNSGPKESDVVKKVEAALLSIAGRNVLNRMRVRMIIPWAFEKEEPTGCSVSDQDAKGNHDG